MKTKFKAHLNENLLDQFLDTIFNTIKDKSQPSIVITVCGQFRFYLEKNYPEKLNEFLYKISDGENMTKVILETSKNMYRDDELSELIHAIFPKYKVKCIVKVRYLRLTYGKTYTVTDEVIEDGKEMLELEMIDEYLPYETRLKEWFQKI